MKDHASDAMLTAYAERMVPHVERFAGMSTGDNGVGFTPDGKTATIVFLGDKRGAVSFLKQNGGGRAGYFLVYAYGKKLGDSTSMPADLRK